MNMKNLKLIDSHFHLPIIAERGLSARESLFSIAGGIDIGTVYNDLEERSALLNELISKDSKAKAVLSSDPESLKLSDQNESRNIQQLFHTNAKIYKSGGMGPWETEGRNAEELESLFSIFKDYAEKFPVDFVGEFGFDFHYNYGNEETQRTLFDLNACYARDHNKKIIIHSRDADESTVCALKAYTDLTGIIHCFSGSLDVMKTALDRGYYISYAGNVTYKSNAALRDTLRYVPKDKLLLETDAPYLSPIPKRGLPNTSLYIIHTYECVSEVLGNSLEELSEEIYGNFMSLTENLT